MQMMQQEQQRLQQEEYMRQQMLMEQQRQQEEFMRQQYLLQQQQQQQQQQALMAQPTGYRSNNPFAPSTSFLGANNPGSSFTPQPQQASSSFLPVPSMPTPQPEPQQPQQQQQQTAKPAFQAPARKDDGQHAGLANLLARGREDGMDTFGNTGNLRMSMFHAVNRGLVLISQVYRPDRRSISPIDYMSSRPGSAATTRSVSRNTRASNSSSSRNRPNSHSSRYNTFLAVVPEPT
jgi:epsin